MKPMFPDLLLLWPVFKAVLRKGDKPFLKLSNRCKKRKFLEYNVQHKISTGAGASEEIMGESLEEHVAEYLS